ncbi:MAG TPA: ATP-binding protein [Bryobacteraceae bacterium]|jgi:signal transduction histidine kinase|nr:ATP-binding protein [Bryobacteraceae bacterium]
MNDSRLELIGSAAAGIAHDVNNQLSLIVNHLQGAHLAAERCAVLTASLLAYCRNEAVVLAPVCPAAFLKSFAAGLSLPAGIDLQIKFPVSLPAIAADTLALTRILTNLISNARDAMGERGTLQIAAKPYIIEVSDSGPGIPADMARKIFEPFFTTKGANGTGLGLSIVRDLMRQQGGSASVDSGPGHGARFKLRFRPPA